VRVGSIVLVALAAATGLFVTSGAGAATAYSDTLTGTEIVPVSSTLGTFVGVATGQLPGVWRVQIAHEPLATGPTVLITGGTFTLRTRSGKRFQGPVTTGSVTVVDRGGQCTNQTYHVSATLNIGSVVGTLTHHRRSFFGRCVIYAATMQGTGTFIV
jgi:hypothetical protein